MGFYCTPYHIKCQLVFFHRQSCLFPYSVNSDSELVYYLSDAFKSSDK